MEHMYSDTSDFNLMTNKDFYEIVNLLLCHAFLKNYSRLISEISKFEPKCVNKENFQGPFKQILVFISFYKKWRETGPLPEIKNYKFLLTLHEEMCRILKSERQLLESMPMNDLIKLVTGVRCLLGKSLLIDEKFVVLDIETFIKKYYPILPVSSDNSIAWNNLLDVFQLTESDRKELKMISNMNTVSVKHLNQRLLNLAEERKRNTADIDASFLTILNSIDSKLSTFMDNVENLIPEDFFISLVKDSSPQVKLLTEKISRNCDEQQLLLHFREIKNLYIESQFWSSDLIKNRIDNL